MHLVLMVFILTLVILRLSVWTEEHWVNAELRIMVSSTHNYLSAESEMLERMTSLKINYSNSHTGKKSSTCYIDIWSLSCSYPNANNLHLWRGYTGVYANGDGDKGEAECPFEFYHQWVTNPKAAQAMAEAVTRPTIGVKCCPVVRLFISPSHIFFVKHLLIFLSIHRLESLNQRRWKISNG